MLLGGIEEAVSGGSMLEKRVVLDRATHGLTRELWPEGPESWGQSYEEMMNRYGRTLKAEVVVER